MVVGKEDLRFRYFDLALRQRVCFVFWLMDEMIIDDV